MRLRNFPCCDDTTLPEGKRGSDAPLENDYFPSVDDVFGASLELKIGFAAGSMAAAKAAGKVRIEGKEYVMADGDVVEFRFNV